MDMGTKHIIEAGHGRRGMNPTFAMCPSAERPPC